MQGISDLITVPGEVNVDFADVKTIMTGMGMALMGTGVAKGENRPSRPRRARSLRRCSRRPRSRAPRVFCSTSRRRDLTLHEVDEAAACIAEAVDPERKHHLGLVIDDEMEDEMKVTVIATGFNMDQADHFMKPRPGLQRPVEDEEPAFRRYCMRLLSSRRRIPRTFRSIAKSSRSPRTTIPTDMGPTGRMSMISISRLFCVSRWTRWIGWFE